MVTIKNAVIVLLALLTSAGSLAVAPWQRISRLVNGSAQSTGALPNGCTVGTEALPLSTTGCQVMRTDQRRYFGHPDLVQFIHHLSNQVYDRGMGIMLIDDTRMSAGGCFNGGHVSYQTGLDADIFLRLSQTYWASSQLLKPQALDLVASDGRHVVSLLWNPQISQLIRLATEDSEVTRIFVNLAIKQQLCLGADNDCQWLRKVRLWFQHRVHMHVRLRCPAGSLKYESQAPPLPGDGCGAELQSWFEPPKSGSTLPVKEMPPPLPPSCQALLDEHVL